jgi:site-specific DNA-cytosine methylase
VERHRPPAVLLENVPGLLSSHAGRDLAALLGHLGELGYGWAFRVLDAQHFGVPQRRRRVFIVAIRLDLDPRGERPAEILAVGTRCGRHPATGHAAWEGTPGEPPGSPDVAGAVLAREGKGVGHNYPDDHLVGSLSASGIDKNASQNVAAGHFFTRDVARSLNQQRGHYDDDTDTDTLVATAPRSAGEEDLAPTLMAAAGLTGMELNPERLVLGDRGVERLGRLQPGGDGRADADAPLERRGNPDGVRDEHGGLRVRARGVPGADGAPGERFAGDPVRDPRGSVGPAPDAGRVRAPDGLARRVDDRYELARAVLASDDSARTDASDNLVVTTAATLSGNSTGGYRLDVDLAENLIPYGFGEDQRGELRTSDLATTPTRGGGKPGQGYPAVVDAPGAPGGEDDLLPAGLDSHRYRCCGNGVVAPVSEWIGQRIAEALA